MNYRSLAAVTAAALFPALCVAFGKGYNYAAILLLLASLPCLVSFPKQFITSDVKLVIIAFSAYFLSFVASTAITGGELSNLDHPSRAVLALPIFLALLRYPPRFPMLATGILSGAVIIGLVGLYFAVMYPQHRAFDGALGPAWIKGYMQIQSGNMAATLGILSLCLSIHFSRQKKWLLVCLALMATIMGITASLLSGSRGGWIFIPLAIAYLFFANRDLINKKLVSLILLSLILLGAGTWSTASVSNRINKSITDLQEYKQNKQDKQNKVQFTSIGVRLELWKSAIYSFTESPLIGLGEEGRLASRIQHGKDGLIDKRISELAWHSHNQFLESMSVMGLMGLIPLLGFFLAPLKLFEKYRHRGSATNQTLCQCGTVSIILMIGYCLTQAYFNHTSGIIFYSVITVILLSATLSPVRKSS